MPEMHSWPQTAQYLTLVSNQTLTFRVIALLEELSYSAIPHENTSVSLMPSSHVLPLKEIDSDQSFLSQVCVPGADFGVGHGVHFLQRCCPLGSPEKVFSTR